MPTPTIEDPADLSPDQAPAQDVATGITPGGAFLRSLLVPGWGHVATDAYARAGFYVTAQSASLWMLLQTIERRGDARDFLELERDLVRARLQASGPVPPDSIASLNAAIEADPEVEKRQELVDARDNQVEDWSALSIFLVLLGATDAFVAAHLADFPEPLSFDVIPRGSGAELRFTVPIGASP